MYIHIYSSTQNMAQPPVPETSRPGRDGPLDPTGLPVRERSSRTYPFALDPCSTLGRFAPVQPSPCPTRLGEICLLLLLLLLLLLWRGSSSSAPDTSSSRSSESEPLPKDRSFSRIPVRDISRRGASLEEFIQKAKNEDQGRTQPAVGKAQAMHIYAARLLSASVR